MGIKRERCTVICVEKGQLLCVRLEDPKSRVIYTVPPGGLIEEDETAQSAAARETLEETGYAVFIDPESRVVGNYPFFWDGKEFDCTTHFFRANLLSSNPVSVDDASYHRGVVWIPLSELDNHLSFHPALYGFIKKLL